ncbi:MAG: PAS domain-containing sensor histidine kinase, partial [Balneolaceae bacterium]
KNLQTGNIDNLDLTLSLRGKDGIYRTILNRGKVVEFDEEGKIVRMIGTHMDVSEKIELMDKVVQSAIEGEDRERKRIASDLHDGIGQYLAASNMNFESVKQELGKLTNKSATRFKRGLKLLKKAMEETRKTAHKLMPEAIEDYGLTLAVESLLENLENSIGVNTGFESTVDESSLDKQTCINLYRIIQEATNNAVMHGQSSNITITLHQEEDKIACTIKDDGIGMNLDDPELEKGLGLQSMRFRVHSMLGTINFDSQPQKGMKITFDIPLNKSNMA